MHATFYVVSAYVVSNKVKNKTYINDLIALKPI